MTGIYIHIPFCVKKCFYCDFYSVENHEIKTAYFDALKNEIESFSKDNKNIKVDTIFFGGGTPSCVNASYISDIVELIKKEFDVMKDAEITIEANPKTFDREKLEIYRNCGINRISIGLQSADDIQLKKLGRIHTADDFEKAYELVRNCGFDNVNIDIMYGLPDEKEKNLYDTMENVLSYNPEHISAYALTISENTPIYRMNYSYPDDDSVYSRYMMICDMLKDYRHYEVSNFGKKICRHNMKYWTLEDYIGFGTSASGYYNGMRYTNTSDISEYIKDTSKKDEIICVNDEDKLTEYVMLSLRTDNGLSYKYILDNFGFDFENKNFDFLKNLYKEGCIKLSNDGFSLTDKGFFVSNSIISSLKTI